MSPIKEKKEVKEGKSKKSTKSAIQNGKGSRNRVSNFAAYREGWERIFGKK